MEEYSIKIPNIDFKFFDATINTKGTRMKKGVIAADGRKAFFKYEAYLASEACSEKISYEIAKVLGYECARIELAQDFEGTLGILNYWFVDSSTSEHVDAISYLGINDKNRSNLYKISNIKRVLDNLDKSLFEGFVRIMVFDALIGEQDRHEENWGIEITDSKYKISPLYDNGDSLLREFKNKDLAELYYSNNKDFNAYINRSKTMIFKEDSKAKYKHFELIDYLNANYSDIVKKEIINLQKLTNDSIEMIVNRIPNELLTKKHKEYIIVYLKKRRDILLNII